MLAGFNRFSRVLRSQPILASHPTSPVTRASRSKVTVSQNGAVKRITLPENVISSFRQYARSTDLNPYDNFTKVRTEAGKVLADTLPSGDKAPLYDLQEKGKTSLVLIENGPVTNGLKPLSPTPSTDLHRPDKKGDYTSEAFMLALSHIIDAQPHLVTNQKGGMIVQQLMPLDPKAISGTGFKIPFDLHTENAHESSPPDTFMLHTLRGDKKAYTTYLPLDQLLEVLPKQIVKSLQKPDFIFKTGSAFHTAEEIRGPVLQKNKLGFFEVRLNTAPSRCEGVTEEAKQALSVVRQAIKALKLPNVNLQAGNTLLLGNKRTFHGRTSFEPSNPPGLARWLQRLYLKTEEG